MTTLTLCVLGAFAAASVIAVMARPPHTGPVQEHLLPGVLVWDNPGPESVTVAMTEDGTVAITRHGLQGLTDTGAVSLAVTVKGFDVVIKERRVEGRTPGVAVDTALFTLDFLGRERYHFSYFIDEHPAAAFAMTLRPDAHYTASLSV